VNLFRKKKYVHCPVCIGKRKYHALMLSSTQIYEVKSLSQQHLAGFQTKAICLTGAWAVSGAPSLYVRQSLPVDWVKLIDVDGRNLFLWGMGSKIIVQIRV